MIAWNLTGNNLCVYIDGRSFTMPTSNEHFRKVMAAVEDDDAETALRYLNAKESISRDTDGAISFDGHSLTYNGETIHNAIVERLHYLWTNELPYNSLLRFMERLMENPSYRAVNELYRFLEACSLPITNDGCFLAYKRVRSNFTDIHSGTFDNSIGTSPRVMRNQVDENPNETCSYGLHVCSADYLPHFASWHGTGIDRIVVVKVDPADVVAVPYDYDNAKMRVCGYTVVRDVTDQFFGKSAMLPEYYTDEHSDDDEVEDELDTFDEVEGTTPTTKPSSNVHVTSATLSEPQVREIKRLLDDGELSIVGIAKLYKVNESTIRKIKKGETWAWLT